MGIVDDVLKAFDRIPIWRRLQEIPAELDELKARMAALEEKLGGRGKWPGDVCPYCGALAMRLTTQGQRRGAGVMEFRYDTWTCQECGKSEERKVMLTRPPK
jgi:uncharacterized protein with PIN domain